VASRRSADADDRSTDRRSDVVRDALQHPFNHNAESPRLIDGARVGNNLFGFALLAAPRAITAKDVDRLRRQTNMTNYWDTAVGQELDRRRHRFATFELHCGAPRLLHYCRGGLECLRRRFLIAS